MVSVCERRRRAKRTWIDGLGGDGKVHFQQLEAMEMWNMRDEIHEIRKLRGISVRRHKFKEVTMKLTFTQKTCSIASNLGRVALVRAPASLGVATRGLRTSFSVRMFRVQFHRTNL